MNAKTEHNPKHLGPCTECVLVISYQHDLSHHRPFEQRRKYLVDRAIFSPQGFGCPQCKAGTQEARRFRVSKRGLVDYRYKRCDRVYNLYTGTVFAGSGLSACQSGAAVAGYMQRGE